jgi:predicted nucleic acid-binding protein
MKRYFIDTNVILDALLHRVDHDPSSAGKLLEAGEQRHVRLLTTSVSIANVLYQNQRNRTSKKGLGLIRARGVRSDLLACVDVVPMDASHFQQGLASTFGDIEDGAQYFAVAAAGPIDAVVSRDEDYDGHIGVPALQPVRLCARSNTNSQYRSTRSR